MKKDGQVKSEALRMESMIVCINRLYQSTFLRGEKYQGMLYSETFSGPERLSFWLVGHNGNLNELYTDRIENWFQACRSCVGSGRFSEALRNSPSAYRGRNDAWPVTRQPILLNLLKTVMLPAPNLARFLPGNAALTDPNLEARIMEEVAINSGQQALDKARATHRLNSIEIQSR